ncbi:MAG: nucleotide exchange factor GrpE [Actinomycetales bacterium]|nr:nucleotide exchange factor GrpE [Actinomycetales bacterium]
MSEEQLNPEGAAGEDNLDSAPAETDAVDAELADLVEETGPISKEAELLADLQRLQAEFVNYKARVERDRDLARSNAVAEVLRALLPALDDLSRAEAHGDLEGSPLASVATKIRNAGDKFGLKQFGAKGDKFDPEQHNALVQTPNPEVTEMVVADVVEPGYQLGDRLLRPAMVAVFIPAE